MEVRGSGLLIGVEFTVNAAPYVKKLSTFNTLDDIPEALMIEALYEANYIEDEINDYMMVEDISISKLAIEEFKGDDKEWEEYGGEIYGKDN